MKHRTILIFLLAASLDLPGARAESLWTKSGYDPRSLFADHKAAHAGDIVTIVVQESNAVQSSQTKEATRKSSLSDALTQFIYPTTASGALTHGGALPATSNTGAFDYTGGGSVNNSQTANSTAAVLITDELPNGNLVIEGVRMLTFSGETQYVVLHGIIRPDDISSTNTIPSTNIADARVEFVSQGALSDEQKLGWFSKLYETLRPF